MAVIRSRIVRSLKPCNIAAAFGPTPATNSNGVILTAALYRIDGVPYGETDKTPEDCNMDEAIKDTVLPNWAAAICAMGDLPPGVVIDFGQLPDGTWAVIEFNEAWASGLYYCDPEKCFDVIVASQQ